MNKSRKIAVSKSDENSNEESIQFGSDSIESNEVEKFQSLLNTLRGSEDFVLDEDGKIISSNLEAITISGYEEWEVIGNHISVFYTDEDINRGKPQEDLSKTVKFGKHISTGLRVKKRGSKFWAKMKFSSIKSDKNSVAKFRVELLDTTHRAMYSMSTKRIKDEYLSLFNNPFVGIFKFSIKELTSMAMNEKAMQIIGIQSTKILLKDIFHDQEDFLRFTQLIKVEKRIENFEFRLSRTDCEMYCSLSCKVYLFGGFIEGVLVDTTEKRSRVAELQRLNSELDNFLYHASHDIRSPLSSILGLVNLIKAEYSQPNLLDYADKIYNRVVHLDNVLKDLAMVAFNNSQAVKLEPIHANETIKNLIKSQVSKYPKTTVRLVANEGDHFCSDAVRINTILTNVISNALKYSALKPNPSISIQFSMVNNLACFEIKDNGIGIKKEYIKDIFELFSKMDSRGSGSGLGLYVVKIMVEALGGKIEIDSEIDIGTKVVIKIPNTNI